MATPLGSPAGPSFAAVATWPGAGVRSQLHVRLARPAASAAATLAGTTMALLVRGQDAWPPDRPGDRRLAASLRAGGLLEVRGRGLDGRRFRDRYPLAGAASAIDAMRLACLAP